MIHAKDINEHSPWQKLTPGCEIYEPGTAAAFNTGDWRTATPIYHADRCKQCLLQFIFNLSQFCLLCFQS